MIIGRYNGKESNTWHFVLISKTLRRRFVKKLIILILAAVLLISLAGCSTNMTAAELKSDKPRITSPGINPDNLTALVNGNNNFAFNLYQVLKDSDGNLFYSPYSISEALAMTYGGSSGTTEQQMAQTLKFTLQQSQLHPTFNYLDQELATRGQGAQGKDSKGFRLNVVNAIWGQKDFPFTSSYLDLLSQNYGAGLRILDYIKSPETSRQTINQWVSDQTEGKIKDLLPSGSITTLTRLVLTNAIYFNAAWAHQFNDKSTAIGTFHLLDGSDTAVPMMTQEGSYNYTGTKEFQALELPYDGNQLSMIVLLPSIGQFENFQARLSGDGVGSIIQSLQSNTVDLTMPKFNIDSQFSLKQTLSELGMPIAFTDQADFSGMDGRRDLLISDVVHKAFVSVDESGTEAAAATGVIVGTTSAPINKITLNLDRPFIFLIRDIQTGTILFIGRVMNPQ
jgi:serpin B